MVLFGHCDLTMLPHSEKSLPQFFASGTLRAAMLGVFSVKRNLDGRSFDEYVNERVNHQSVLVRKCL